MTTATPPRGERYRTPKTTPWGRCASCGSVVPDPARHCPQCSSTRLVVLDEKRHHEPGADGSKGEEYRAQGATYVRLGKARLARLRRIAGREHGALQAAMRAAVDLYLDSTQRARETYRGSVREGR